MPEDDKRRLLAIYHMEEMQVLALALVNTSDFNCVGLRWRFYHVNYVKRAIGIVLIGART